MAEWHGVKESTSNMEQTGTYRLAIDIGGTFTDVVLLNQNTHDFVMVKVPTTPSDRSEGFFHGTEKILAENYATGRDVANITHGSTVATNAVLEGKGSRMGLLTTLGFRDILEIGRAYIPGIFTNYFKWEKPERLVPLDRVRAVPGRLDVHGETVVPLDLDAARAAIEELLADDVEAIAISLLHSYVDSNHEEELEKLIRELAPEMFVSRSSAVLPEYREYERTVTTVLNAYVMPAVARYLERIQDGLIQRQLPPTFNIVRSDAGVMSLDAARDRPVNTVLSGPAGGVRGASSIAALAGYPNVVTMDMGGTSTDVCLSTSGEPRLSTDAWISHYPIRVPIVDITTIGAGGGSIASISSSGALRVGPESAGSDPGPACYGRGGDRPTVTDANLVLGRLPVDLAGGEVHLDVGAAREALRRHIAAPTGMTVEEAALGIIRIVDEAMLGALRVVSVQRGLDPRDLALLPFGGAGPVHGGNLGRLAGIDTMLVPQMPGVLSALGFLLADVRQVFTLTRVGVLGKLNPDTYNKEIKQLVATADEWLEREQVGAEDRAIEIALDLRYSGQAYELSIAVNLPLDEASWADAAERFHAEHKRRYGFDQPFTEVEVVTLRVTGIGVLAKPEIEATAPGNVDASAAIVGTNDVIFEDGTMATPFYDRMQLTPGHRFTGPAIILQPDCTTVIHPGQETTVDGFGNLVVKNL